ncbi:hypothetical protein [uncultured Metabacillus sp.]|uniref:hypothetical protein n=1 Tax=uncultured Metabacillus sp. TaxID=2860135 RepID=UPI0026128D82|nr:hypothetical protein [uncultured Metabacillus sp.]
MKSYVFSIGLFFFMIGFSEEKTFAASIENRQAPISFQITLQNWEAVNHILQKKSTFTVIDVETGKSFEVQRRAGSRHADVQPITKKDTKIMKEIYDGRWSWRRKAVLILANDSLIPASMHGMPHGAGALQNGFPGHFCIHFPGSTTHRSGKADLSHHVMILKAAGKIDDYFTSLQAEQLINVFLVTIKNQDQKLAEKISISNQKKWKQKLNNIEQIEAIQWSLPQTTNKETRYSLVTQIPVEIKMFIKERGAVKTNLVFTLMRTSPLSPWKVNIDPLLSSIN